MPEAAGAPRPDDTGAPDEQKKVHRTETKTRTTAEAKSAGPTLDTVKADPRVKTYIRSANQQTGAIGYTEHGERHANTSADGARFILKSLGHDARDRKSTRLNSSHLVISYAVFCLKKTKHLH